MWRAGTVRLRRRAESLVIWHPQEGMHVELHYRKSMRVNGLHLSRGVVRAVGKGLGPINAAVMLDDGTLVFVPRGNLVELWEEMSDDSTQ